MGEISEGVPVRPYIRASLGTLAKFVDLRGQRVLEIGGDLPSDVAMGELGVSSWVCVDDRSGWARSMGRRRTPGTPVSTLRSDQIESGWSLFDSSVHDIPALAEGQFDLVVSFAALEHIPSVPKLIRGIRSFLRPGGSAWLLVGPIWSGYRGYHIYPNDFRRHEDETAAFLAQVEPWQHLLMSGTEFHRWAQIRWGEDFADLLHASIYESPRINRLWLSDYRLAFANQLKVVRYQEWPCPAGVDAQLARVSARYPQQQGFHVDGFNVLLRREPDSEASAPS